MTVDRPGEREPGPIIGLLTTARFSATLSVIGIGLAAFNTPLVKMIGWAGYLAALSSLIALMLVVIVLRRNDLRWRTIPPVSVLAFVGWAGISVVWSQYRWVSVSGTAYLIAFTFIALFIAYTRDTIQIVRAMGDVCRILLGVSLVLEVFSGLIIDAPIPFFAIGGHIVEFGPISGIAQNRNQLGMFALIGAVSFATEVRTRSVPLLTGVLSLVLAAISIALTRSALIYGAAILIAIAAAVLYGIRRVRPDRRQLWQFVILGLLVVATILAWFFRGRIVSLFNADGELDYRLRVWDKIATLLPENPIEGWGWAGRWHPEVAPFSSLTTSADRPASSALNAYLDVLFQVGAIGLVIFLGMLGLAFTRSWLLAGRRRSIIYAWPALTLIALIVISLAESSILGEFGWLTFVICSTTASQELSWRQALSTPPEPVSEPSDAAG